MHSNPHYISAHGLTWRIYQDDDYESLSGDQWIVSVSCLTCSSFCAKLVKLTAANSTDNGVGAEGVAPSQREAVQIAASNLYEILLRNGAYR